jgi:dGTPase
MIRTRHHLEDREAAFLAPYATLSSAAGPREHDEPEDPLRTAFQRDRDRIVHSAAFRALQHKTQVFVVHEGELARTRLTHTIEVAQIARSVASYLGANETLAEAIALAHDLGHGPFGHQGEEEISDALVALGLPEFDHNWQSLRIVTELERHDPSFPGLNLSLATREGIARHETAYDRPAEVKAYYTSRQPSMEAQIANIADPLAYTTHDLEDALKLRFFEEEELRELGLPLVEAAFEGARKAGEALPKPHRRAARLHTVHRRLIGTLIQDLLQATEKRLQSLAAGGRPPTAAEVRAADAPVVDFSPERREEIDRLRKFLHANVYKHPTVKNMCTKGRRILRMLFEHYTRHADHLPRSVQTRFPEGVAPTEPRAAAPVVADYLCGLTDRGAMDGYQMLFEPYERTLVSLE